jgi:hypothetical protein
MTLILNGTDNSATTPAVTGTDTDTGVYYPAANQVALATNGTLALIVDASQNVGIGAAPAVAARLELRSTAKAVSWFASTNTTPNSILMTGGSSANYGVVGVNNSDNTAAGDQFQLGWTTSASAATNGVLLWGRGGNCIGLNTAPSTSGTGITFPTTQNASSDVNTLDDYEEGTFTPVLNRDGTSPTVTYTDRQGRYTKVGNVVTVSISVVAASVSSAGSGNTTITGLPFANGSTTYTGQGAIGYNTAAVNTLSGSWMSSTSVLFRSGTRSDGNDAGGWQTGYYDMSITYLV